VSDIEQIIYNVKFYQWEQQKMYTQYTRIIVCPKIFSGISTVKTKVLAWGNFDCYYDIRT